MDDMSVFRRFFVVSGIIREFLTAMNPQMSVESIVGQTSGGSSEEPVDASNTLGGSRPPIRGSRPVAASRTRRRRGAPQLPNTARYAFPKPVD